MAFRQVLAPPEGVQGAAAQPMAAEAPGSQGSRQPRFRPAVAVWKRPSSRWRCSGGKRRAPLHASDRFPVSGGRGAGPGWLSPSRLASLQPPDSHGSCCKAGLQAPAAMQTVVGPRLWPWCNRCCRPDFARIPSQTPGRQSQEQRVGTRSQASDRTAAACGPRSRAAAATDSSAAAAATGGVARPRPQMSQARATGGLLTRGQVTVDTS